MTVLSLAAFYLGTWWPVPLIDPLKDDCPELAVRPELAVLSWPGPRKSVRIWSLSPQCSPQSGTPLKFSGVLALRAESLSLCQKMTVLSFVYANCPEFCHKMTVQSLS